MPPFSLLELSISLLSISPLVSVSWSAREFEQGEGGIIRPMAFGPSCRNFAPLPVTNTSEGTRPAETS